MEQDSSKHEQNVLKDAVAAYLNGGLEGLGRSFLLNNAVSFGKVFFRQLSDQIEDAFYHMPKVPRKKDGSPKTGTDAYRIYTMMDCELYAIYRILQHDVSPQILQQAYDMVYPHFFSSRWKMDQILDRFFADREKT